MEESERFEANQEATVGEGDREANQKEEPSGRSWGFHSSIPSLSHTMVLGDDRGNGDLVASVSVHDIENGVLFSSMSVQVGLKTSDTIGQEMIVTHKCEGLRSLGEPKLNQVTHFRFLNQI